MHEIYANVKLSYPISAHCNPIDVLHSPPHTHALGLRACIALTFCRFV
ncbi:MAG: hypothetical protein AAFU83_00720 [Bacteroidota bacterium]